MIHAVITGPGQRAVSRWFRLGERWAFISEMAGASPAVTKERQKADHG